MDESTLQKLFNDSISQYNAVQALNIKVPEFHGLPNEDVNKFIKKFRASTMGFPVEVRCRFMKKALKDSAQIWSKTHLKELLTKTTLTKQDWQIIKKLLRERFSEFDPQSTRRQQLNRMKYKEGDVLLSCYVEDYLSCYKSAYPNHEIQDALQALQANLPHRIIIRLNYINSDWTSLRSIHELIPIIRKLETKILPYEPQEESVSSSINEKTIMDLFSGFKSSVEDMIKDTVQKASEKTTSLQLALLDKQSNQDTVNEQSNYNRSESRNNSHYRPFFKPHKRQPNFRDSYNEKKNKTDDKQADNNTRTSEPSVSDLEKAYFDKYRKPARPCSLCKGPHWDKHCPFFDLN